MKYLGFILIIVITLASCQNVERVSKPDNLIAEDKMVDIYIDLSFYDAAQRLNNRKVNIESKAIDPYIYNKYKIDSLQLIESNRYYAQFPKEYGIIFDSVKSKIDRLKTELDTLKAIADRKEDSLKEISKKDNDSIKLKVKRELVPKLKRIVNDTVAKGGN